jgi:protein-disulfide isomerase/uncharacterized membrane protein
LIDLLQVLVTDSGLEKSLRDHPDFPSMLSLSDVFSGYGIGNAAINAREEDLDHLPTPFIATMKGKSSHKELYTVINAVKTEQITYFDPELHREQVIDREEFIRQWSSATVLIANAEDAPGEKDYRRMRWEEKKKYVARLLSILALPGIAAASGIAAFRQYGAGIFYEELFVFASLLGTLFSGILIWYELDWQNPVLQQLCGIGNKINCDAILHSRASKIAGISWSTIGFVYFLGETLFVLLPADHPSTFFIAAWINILALPYILFSITYQWRVARQWCPLCLSVQGVLLLQAATVFAGGWLLWPGARAGGTIPGSLWVNLIAAGLIPFCLVNLLLPALRAAQESRHFKMDLNKLKYNPQLFESLLQKQTPVTVSTEGLGIVLGNPNGANMIIKVCNPYCPPCASAHTVIDELLDNNPDIRVQILFMSRPDEYKALPVRHFLAIAESTNDSTFIRQALHEWYGASKKDYPAFAARYPMNGELKMQDQKIEAMHAWCSEMEVRSTPSFFINGFRVPAGYNMEDLKYFLSV